MNPYPSSPYQARCQELEEELDTMRDKVEEYEQAFIILNALLQNNAVRNIGAATRFVARIVSQIQS